MNSRTPPQLVENPFFKEWAGQKPVGWAVLGNPALSDTELDGVRVLGVEPNTPRDGMIQRLTVKEGTRYFLRILSSGPWEIFIRVPSLNVKTEDQAADAFHKEITEGVKRTVGGLWKQQSNFLFTAPGPEIDLIFRPVGVAHLAAVTVRPFERDSTPSTVRVPRHPVFFSIGSPNLFEVLPSVNVMSETPHDPQLLAKLRSRGVLCLTTVPVPKHFKQPLPWESMACAVEEFVVRCAAPFHDTFEGMIPGGADGIIIDELDGWRDGDYQHKLLIELWERTLAWLRSLYPNKS